MTQAPPSQSALFLAAIDLQEQKRRYEVQHPDLDATLERCETSFAAFLPFWRFINRENGQEESFANLWPGQSDFVEVMEREAWIFALKAGKLGFTELECAYDGWVMRFRQRNARVHVFSRDATAATTLLDYIRYGLSHLPEWMRLPVATDERGSDTGATLKLTAGPDDVRVCARFASAISASIDLTCTHAHVDELAVMQWARQTWNSVVSTVAPGGSCHIVTRGAGESTLSAAYVAELWRDTVKGGNELYPFFQAWQQRPDRDRIWYEKQATKMTPVEMRHFAPETDEDALAGDEDNDFVPIELWDACIDPDLPLLLNGSKELCVLGVDAAVKNDCFGIVLGTRHPNRPDDIAVRAVRLWTPTKGREVDMSEPEAFIRSVALGGCALGHWKKEPMVGVEGKPDCELCKREDWLPPYNVYEVAYDPAMMESTAQRLRKDGINMREFLQGKDRLIADSSLRDLIVNKHIAHTGNPHLRDHIQNAGARIEAREERTIRIVKKAQGKKIDLAVCTSQMARRLLRLRL